MTWTVETSNEMNPNVVYAVLKKHKLLPESVAASASVCNVVGTSGARFLIKDESGDVVCNVFVSSVEPDETASLDIIPVAKYFRADYADDFRSAMAPVLDDLFNELKVRRVASLIPESRSRTKRALCALGFVVEGRARKAVRLHGREPEDLRILGLLKSDYEKGLSDGT